MYCIKTKEENKKKNFENKITTTTTNEWKKETLRDRNTLTFQIKKEKRRKINRNPIKLIDYIVTYLSYFQIWMTDRYFVTNNKVINQYIITLVVTNLENFIIADPLLCEDG